MDELMIKIENVSKEYKLGQIGGTTLRDELQRLSAKIRHKEDPTKKIGAKDYNKGEKFMALNGVSFEVKKGERVGIIGHNGAGKSTLLKLLSRITAPTGGTISLNGRIASMLEVGTGFHPELTGRENVYMNGAILGMTKKEIDAKMDDIIEFSECRQFIDTPVKRYSSGMYVKLAFSVAAHLDSEIMIMDEVLAVGDMKFQQKCLTKMSDVSKQEGRTILYVSHNMNTIRQLCDRVIVLNHGRVIFDGDVEEGINIYMGTGKKDERPVLFDLDIIERLYQFGKIAKLKEFCILDREQAIFTVGEKIRFKVIIDSSIKIQNAKILLGIRDLNNNKIGTAVSESFEINNEINQSFKFELDLGMLVQGEFLLNIALFEIGKHETSYTLDDPGLRIIIDITGEFAHGFKWIKNYWGSVCFPEIDLL